MTPTVRRAISIAALLVAAGTVLGQVLAVLLSPGPGIDFLPLRHAAQDLWSGHSVYRDHFFVYPPSAAVVLLPTAAGSEVVSYCCWTVLCMLALTAAAVLIGSTVDRRHRLLVTAVVFIPLMGGCVTTESLPIGNFTMVLVPFAVLALLAFERGRWLLGCAVLAVSLLLKPLLAPLLLVPAIRRRWRDLALALTPAAAVGLVAVLLVPGGRSIVRILRYDAAGSNLHGRESVNNLSLAGWVEWHHASPDVHVIGVVLVLAVAAGALVRAALDRTGAVSPVLLGNLAFVTVLLAGRLSEMHFLLALEAGCLLQICLAPRSLHRWLVLPGVAMLGVMQSVRLSLGAAVPQTWYVVAELLVLAATAAGVHLALVRRTAPLLTPALVGA